MQTKKFQHYLEKRLTDDEIKTLEQHARLERKILHSLHNDIAQALKTYMQKNKITLKEVAQLCTLSTPRLTKIIQGKANLTLASMAHLFAFLEQEPHLVFNKK